MASKQHHVNRFRPPRHTALGTPLIRMAREGTLTSQHIERARERVTRSHRQVLSELWHEECDIDSHHREQLNEAFLDAFQLLMRGLDDMLLSLENQDPAPFRQGTLLLEKGEEEYLWLMREMRRDERPGQRGSRNLNLWGQLLSSLQSARPEEIPELMLRTELTLRDQLEGTQRDFRRILPLLPEATPEAERQLQASLMRLREFLGFSA